MGSGWKGALVRLRVVMWILILTFDWKLPDWWGCRKKTWYFSRTHLLMHKIQKKKKKTTKSIHFTNTPNKKHIFQGYLAGRVAQTYRRRWNRSGSFKYTYYSTQTGYICSAVYKYHVMRALPFGVNMLVPLGTGKSILWLGIISAQYNTTAITADKTGIKRSHLDPDLLWKPHKPFILVAFAWTGMTQPDLILVVFACKVFLRGGGGLFMLRSAKRRQRPTDKEIRRKTKEKQKRFHQD